MQIHRKSILVIDEEGKLSERIDEPLTLSNFDVITATNIQEAVVQLSQKQFDCILTKLNFGRGRGVDLIKFIRANKCLPNSDTPIIVASGRTNNGFLERSEILIKGIQIEPVCGNSLAQIVSRVVGANKSVGQGSLPISDNSPVSTEKN